MRKWSWYREGWGGLPDEHWEEVIRKAGYATDDEAPHFRDSSPFHDKALRPGDVRDKKAFPDLGCILAGVQPGDRLGVGDFGMLGASAVWAWAADILVKKGISVEDCTTRFVLDFSRPGASDAGYAMALGQRDGAKTAAARKAAPKGRPKKLDAATAKQVKKDNAAGDTVPVIAKRYGVSVATVNRRLKD